MSIPWTSIASVYDPVTIGSIDGTDTEPHDHGIVRACNATYRPNLEVVGNPECTIFIARLNHATTEETIEHVFSRYGQIKRLRLVRDIVTGFSKGYAFVEYFDESDVEKAYKNAHKLEIDDKMILVDYVFARSMEGWIPRRLGGGFGGKKESGQLRFGCRDRPFRKPIFLPGGRFYDAGDERQPDGRRFRENYTNGERSVAIQSDISEESARELAAEYRNSRKTTDRRQREVRDDRSRIEPKTEVDYKDYDKLTSGVTRTNYEGESGATNHSVASIKREPDTISDIQSYEDTHFRRSRTHGSRHRSRSRERYTSKNLE